VLSGIYSWFAEHQRGIIVVMKPARRPQPALVTARTIRFPESLRARLGADAERCGRSFDAQVIAILRRHYGEDVDLAPAADQILEFAHGSLAGLSPSEVRNLTRRLRAPNAEDE
jgi:hypothetical protein